jgi:hypothetical protein
MTSVDGLAHVEVDSKTAERERFDKLQREYEDKVGEAEKAHLIGMMDEKRMRKRKM